MDECGAWANVFFSDNLPEFIREVEGEVDGEVKFRLFCSEDENWKLGSSVDKTRRLDENSIQVFWLPCHGRRTYIAKVFPDYTKRQATEQLRRLRLSESQMTRPIDDAVHEFDRFFREARACSHLDRFCPNRERIYFPKFHGVITDLERSRFSSGYAQRRAIVLEAVKPNLRSRRILAEGNTSLLPESFSQSLAELHLSTFEHEWYRSLLHDRLCRLDALHRIGITHGDVKDCHFRLPGDIYDTVLYDFSESYTFSPKWPFRVNSGRPRPVRSISEGERRRVRIQVEKRAMARDLRSHLIKSTSEHIVDNALWQPLDEEEGLLELILFRVWICPDYFSMPTLNSVFPFLETVCPESDPGWHIRRGRLLNRYKSVWAVLRDDGNHSTPILFDGEPQPETVEVCDRPLFLLCLIPKSWNISLGAKVGSTSKDTELSEKLQQACFLLVSSENPGCIIERGEFLRTDGEDT